MKIAITGGAGFIGKRLAQSLEQSGHQIQIIDTIASPATDIMDQQELSKACEGCDVIYHLAALHRDDIFPRSRYYDVNTQGTKNVIQAAEDNDIKHMIFTSTFALYGLNTGMPNEDSKPKPFNDYGKSKWEAEVALKKWTAKDSANKATIVRPVVVFGEGNRGNVYTLISQIVRNKFVMIGNGKNKKSMAYVGNVASFLEFSLHEKEQWKVYNYADKLDYNMQDLTDDIYHHLGRKKPKVAIPYVVGLGIGYGFDVLARLTSKQLPISSVRVKKFCADTTCEAQRCLDAGYTPTNTLKQGVMRMIDADFSEHKQG